MDASAQKILKDLKAGKFKPVYVLQGEETYYIDVISNYIENNALAEHERGFNQVVLYGKDTPIHVLLTHAKRYPMMSDRQVVIVREAQDIPDLQKEQGMKLMLDYLQRPVPSTVLVLCHKHKTLDKRRELGKKVEQLAESATFKKPYDNKLPEFVESYILDKSLTIDDYAVRLLCEYVGNDLNRLANEMDKVAMSMKGTSTITAESIMQQVGISREYNIFELQKAIITRDLLNAAKIVNYFEANSKRSPVIPMVAYLYSFFSKLLAASVIPDKSEKGLINSLKINPYAVKDYSLALRNFNTQSLEHSFAFIRQADLKLKGVNSGSQTEGQILKELVTRLVLI